MSLCTTPESPRVCPTHHAPAVQPQGVTRPLCASVSLSATWACRACAETEFLHPQDPEQRRQQAALNYMSSVTGVSVSVTVPVRGSVSGGMRSRKCPRKQAGTRPRRVAPIFSSVEWGRQQQHLSQDCCGVLRAALWVWVPGAGCGVLGVGAGCWGSAQRDISCGAARPLLTFDGR